MNKVFRTIFLLGTVLLFAGNVWALPMAGGQIRMEMDYTVPYALTDLNDGTVYSSFCLESQNYFYPGATYTVVSVGDVATGGGPGTPAGSDPVEEETKWLYVAHMSDVCKGMAYAESLVQTSMWCLEGEYGGQENAWIMLSQYDFDSTGWKMVSVNISLSGADNQSKLIGSTAPVPEPATMLLLGTGLIGLAGLGRRKLRK